MTLFIAPILKFLTLIGGLLAAVFLIRRDAKRDAVAKKDLLTAKEALALERERIARDEAINGAADLAALARNSGLVRHTEH